MYIFCFIVWIINCQGGWYYAFLSHCFSWDCQTKRGTCCKHVVWRFRSMVLRLQGKQHIKDYQLGPHTQPRFFPLFLLICFMLTLISLISHDCHVVLEVFLRFQLFSCVFFPICFSFVWLVVWFYIVLLYLLTGLLIFQFDLSLFDWNCCPSPSIWAAVVTQPHDDRRKLNILQIWYLVTAQRDGFQDNSWEWLFGWWFPWRFRSSFYDDCLCYQMVSWFKTSKEIV